MAKRTAGRREIPWTEVADLVAAAWDTMMVRREATLGDETLLDCLDAIQARLEGLADPAMRHMAALEATDTAPETCRGRESRLGRVRMYRERSRRPDEPGMLACQRIVAVLAAASPAPENR